MNTADDKQRELDKRYIQMASIWRKTLTVSAEKWGH